MDLRKALDFVKKQDKSFEQIGYDNVFERIKKDLGSMRRDKEVSRFFKAFFNDYKMLDATKESKLEPHIDYVLNRVDKNKIIIFSIDYERLSKVKMEDVDKSKLVFPFHSFFVETPLYYVDEENKEIYGIAGFLVELPRPDKIFIHYVWSRIVRQGFGGNFFLLNRHTFNKQDFDGNSTEEIGPKDQINPFPTLPKEIGINVRREIVETISKIIFLIDKKEYTYYRKHGPSGEEQKEIVYSRDVMSHKRHFWPDTGFFKIASLSKKELAEKGYGVDELVYRDGELRQDVPFTIIGSYRLGEEPSKSSDNRRVELIKRKILRQEEKLGEILSEIFPLVKIDRHNRRRLKGLELDFYIHELSLAFEYDGEQHFDENLCREVFKSDFVELKRRDKMKNTLCRKKRITLIRVSYKEQLNKSKIITKIKEFRPDIKL